MNSNIYFFCHILLFTCCGISETCAFKFCCDFELLGLLCGHYSLLRYDWSVTFVRRGLVTYRFCSYSIVEAFVPTHTSPSHWTRPK